VNNDMDLALLAAQQHQLVTVGDVARCGIAAGRWRRLQDAGWWVPVTPSHFRPGNVPLTFEMRLRASAAWLGNDAALFGSTALFWLGVDVPEPERPEFLAPRSRRSLLTPIILHTTTRWSRGDVITHREVRTSTCTRALIDLTMVERSARVIEHAIDDSVRLRRTSLPTLRRRSADLSGSGRNGVLLLRELLLDSGGESHLERRFLRLVREHGLPRPRTQVTFAATSTRAIRVDFLFGSVVVEVSGRLGHTSDRDRQKDARRRNQLQQDGFLVLEFTTADVIDDPAHVVATLRRSLPVT
jgi:very-short-patch-repair endonuclease